MNSNAPIALRLYQLNDITDDISELQTNLALKQDLLVSGVNIKTINGNTLLGSGDLIISDITITGLVFVQSLSDLPAPVLGIITLLANTCYFFTAPIDLLGSRIVCQANIVILGTSSETASITSTGLVLPLITTTYTLDIRNISLTADIVFDINGFGNTCALDWTAVNLIDCPTIGTIKNFQNFIFDKGSFINSSNLTFDGTSQTIAINNSLLSGRSTGTIITIPTTAAISRRFRITYSSIVVPTGTIGINFSALASVPTESYFLDTINFSNTGTYITGLTQASNKTLFVNCKGIANTAVNGQMYMQGNTTPTVITNTTDFVKVAGVTIASPDNEKYLHSNNRLTNDAVLERRLLIMATLAFNAGTNNECEFGFYDSKLGGIRPDTITATTAMAGGRAENTKLMSLITHKQGDYLEIWCRNLTIASNIIVESLNVIVVES